MAPRLTSPTGLGLRGNDAWGSGAWLAKRGGRLHYGVDFRCQPDQDVVMPTTAQVVRRKYPYKDDLSWSGVLLRVGGWEVTLFYVQPTVQGGVVLPAGAVIGKAQDIRRRYDSRMTAHVHLEVEVRSRSLLKSEWEEGKDYVEVKERVVVNPMLLMG